MMAHLAVGVVVCTLNVIWPFVALSKLGKYDMAGRRNSPKVKALTLAGGVAIALASTLLMLPVLLKG